MNPRTHHQHEETLTVAGREYRCLFRREVDAVGSIVVFRLGPNDAEELAETLDEARANGREEIEAWVETAEVSADYSARFR